MNKYAEIVRNHWMTWLAPRVQEMTAAEFEEFVERYSEEIEQEIATLEAALTAKLDPSMDYLQRVAALMTARTTAESDVLREMLPAPEAEMDEGDEPDPRFDPVDQFMDEAWDTIEEQNRTFSSKEAEFAAVQALAEQYAAAAGKIPSGRATTEPQ